MATYRRGLVKALPRRFSLAIGALFMIGCQDPKPTTGALIVDVTGLPSGAAADVRVLGPNSFSTPVTGTTTLEKLQPGEYTVSISTVTFSNALFSSSISQEKHTVTAGNTAKSNVAYAITGGSIDLTISGLPQGIGPNVLLVGPNGFSRSVLASGVQGGLPAGQYIIRADTITAADGDRYGANAFSQTISVPASLTSVPAAVSYGIVSGTLALTVDGLPSSQNPPPIVITGPGSFERTTSVTATFKGLNAGTYTITARKAGSCPLMYTAAQEQQVVSVTAGATVPRTVTYNQLPADDATLNLRIDGAYIVQVTQDYGGNVPMIAGKPGLLRVFGVANQCNTATPRVRVTLSNGTVVDNVALGSGQTSTLIAPDEGTLAASWNVPIPASAMQPGLTFVAEIDPGNEIAETSESDNRFPDSGTRAVTVRTLPPTPVKVLPIVQSNGLTGTVMAESLDSLLVISRKLLPVVDFAADLGAPLNVDTVLQTDGRGWARALSQVLAAQSGGPQYFYGVVKINCSGSCVAGIGYIGQKASLGWDFRSSWSSVMAHELGHNFALFHTPCGGPAQPDPAYPKTGYYVGGFVGTFGYDVSDNTVKDPRFYSDIMGYCTAQWISDFSYVKGLSHLLTQGSQQQAVRSGGEQPSLLVWGRIVNGQPVLEPAFEISGRPRMPAPGPHRLTAVGTDGTTLFDISFAADRVADLPGSEEAFAFTIPRSMLRGRELAQLRLTSRTGRVATSVASAAIGTDARMTLSRAGSRAMRLQWDATRVPMVMVRDPVTGDIIAFARGGNATIVTDRTELELNYSNRVRSIRELKRLQ
jgi:hypothetical protein